VTAAALELALGLALVPAFVVITVAPLVLFMPAADLIRTPACRGASAG
jgi:hypothetical protein